MWRGHCSRIDGDLGCFCGCGLVKLSATHVGVRVNLIFHLSEINIHNTVAGQGGKDMVSFLRSCRVPFQSGRTHFPSHQPQSRCSMSSPTCGVIAVSPLSLLHGCGVHLSLARFCSADTLLSHTGPPHLGSPGLSHSFALVSLTASKHSGWNTWGSRQYPTKFEEKCLKRKGFLPGGCLHHD